MPADLFCTKCGHRNAIDARFCSSCGAAMEAVDSGEETTITFAPVDGTGEIRFTIANEETTLQGDLAWVTCTEAILSRVAGRVAVTTVLATNIFELASAGWLMVHHHASHVLGSSAPAEGEFT